MMQFQEIAGTDRRTEEQTERQTDGRTKEWIGPILQDPSDYRRGSNKESKKQPFRICLSVKLADGRMSKKKEEISSCLVYNIVRLGKMARKTKPFHEDKLNMSL